MSSAVTLPGVPGTGLPVGTLLTYNAQIATSIWVSVIEGIGSPADLLNEIKTALAEKWDLEITDSQYNEPGIFSTPVVNLQLQIQMFGPLSYGAPDDVRSIVDGEIIATMGGKNYINSSNISSFTLPPDRSGQPSTKSTGADPYQTPGAGVVDAILQKLGIEQAPVESVNAPGSSSSLSLSTKLILAAVVILIALIVVISLRPEAPARIARSF